MKVSNRIKVNKAHPITTGWSLKLLSTVILGCMASSAGHTTDLEIYQGATYGNASIMMMLDNSGSMGPTSLRPPSRGGDYNLAMNVSSSRVWYCESGRKNAMKIETITQTVYDDAGDATTDTVDYEIEYCEVDGVIYETRLTRLKKALMPLFANPKSDIGFGEDVDLSKYRIGLGTFYSNGRSDGGGQIITPVLDMTQDNRKKLLNKVAAITANTNTPTAKAYAEAGAYMLGTNPGGTGFTLSANITKKTDGRSYQSPISSNSTQCDGYGVYFLTDGEPNNSYSESGTISLMNNTLIGGDTIIGATCRSGLSSNGTLFGPDSDFGASGWECIGEYSQALYNNNNAKGVPIATATVGFGAPFKELNEQAKISKTITLPSGVREVIDVYDCDSDSITSQDAKNVCKLGEKGQGYGEGD